MPDPEIPHFQLSDDVDAGILTVEEANAIAQQMADEAKEENLRDIKEN